MICNCSFWPAIGGTIFAANSSWLLVASRVRFSAARWRWGGVQCHFYLLHGFLFKKGFLKICCRQEVWAQLIRVERVKKERKYWCKMSLLNLLYWSFDFAFLFTLKDNSSYGTQYWEPIYEVRINLTDVLCELCLFLTKHIKICPFLTKQKIL